MYEVDYLWVGEKTDTGDAIAMRFTHPVTGSPVVVIIDGGFRETGERLVEHVRRHYDTDRVDLVVCTHPDNDHIMGLFTVVEKLRVARLLVHRPSQFGYGPSDDVKSELVEELVTLAQRLGTIIDDDTWAGASYFGDALRVAGPTKAYYRELLEQETDTTARVLAALTHWQTQRAGATTTLVKAARTRYFDPGETLTDDNGGTTPRNNSSFVLDLQVEDARALFTGDAGAPALERAQELLAATGRSERALDLFDVPHHGSRHNVTRDLLDRILGTETVGRRGIAIASVGAQADDHPRPEVANALKRRGYPVFRTAGMSLWWHSTDAPFRWDYAGEATALDWLEEGDD